MEVNKHVYYGKTRCVLRLGSFAISNANKNIHWESISKKIKIVSCTRLGFSTVLVTILKTLVSLPTRSARTCFDTLGRIEFFFYFWELLTRDNLYQSFNQSLHVKPEIPLFVTISSSAVASVRTELT